MSTQEVAEAINAYLWHQRKIHTSIDHRFVSRYESGVHRWPAAHYREAFRAVLGIGVDAELGFYINRLQRYGSTLPKPQEVIRAGEIDTSRQASNTDSMLRDGADDELDAVELSRRVAATDVGAETLTALGLVFDELATSYATTPPAELIPRVRRHLAYVGQLIGVRKTLTQQRQLLVVGGWLSLLGATIHIDLRQETSAYARLATANQMAEQAGHAEIQAWCLETRAWDFLTRGDFLGAVELSRQAQAMAPRGSSAFIQATAQEGRAWARMGQHEQTRDAMRRMSRLVSSLPVPDRPEHHYRYDPDKALSYTATTLAWAGDPSAEEYARTVIGQLETAGTGVVARPRRVASARLDLGLALLANSKPDEATAVAIDAITSGRVVASNWWRATEIITRVDQSGIPEAADLRDAYEEFRPAPCSR